ncbi:uncharacterized protein SPPG_05682 [Spizellomyces punctatus DAOM BR117]|uniref:Uncharacterized protein n=1 Tax=Spizellomyces punctatus (strain DAOM BR117) TaxID=645134 RepID=A0A0L0HEI2_SPIPD|nr:hypothetical protein, variant [Spizellomyces punctatus DAOM BR117]XP_016607482.1 uncharacterized protein SPPG_05682 [Spizellomyces punctatus DAOM BR117]KNC99441.1 hypothetical protein, variant [Spizellomyces punctatus DAOM BR117]KNC99442.1 hypothetical protein SPPG_05682 [Spizellomyces punctatus DAOM BR117]|eukprot:XP_016607481.1 hypothetical protein, variant [Spizellomyces punctatus DAOM BR117]
MATSSSCSDHDRGSSEDDLLIAGRPAAASAKRKMLLPATTEDSFSEDDPSTRKKARKPLGKKTKPTTVQTALRRKKRKLPPATEGSEDESKSSKENRAAAASMEEAEFVSGTRVLEYMRVAYTGARIGDLLEGTNPVTKGALMRVCQSNILPMKRKLNKIRAEPALWRAFLRQLGTLAFFANMTEVERGIWLAEHEQGKERMGSEDDEDLNSVRFQILGLGSSVLASDVISPSDVDQLMEDNPREWQGVDVARMIPANNESNSSTEGGRHTLFFIKGWWKISTDAQIIPSFEGPTIDLARGALSLGNAVEAAAASTQLFRIEGLNVEGASEEDRLPIAVRVPIGAPVVTKFDSLIDSHILPLWCSFDESSRVELVRAQVQFVQRQLNRYAASALKSLLQKLIRFPSRQVTEFFPKALQMTDGQLMELEEERKKETLAACRAIDTRLVLLVTSCMLLGKPMSFNPDIGRQVSGLESFLKRLAIILFEDSSFDDEGASALSLMAGALMAQRVRSWRPTSALLSQWLRTALQAWATPLCFRYDIEAGAAIEPYAIGLNTTAIQATSALLDALKSFPGDLAMVRFIASKPDVAVLRFNAGVAGRNRDAWHGFQNLPIYHAWDQHCAANIGYFFDPQLVRRLCATSPPGKPFSALFERLFKEVTGANPRRTVLEQETFEALPFVAPHALHNVAS